MCPRARCCPENGQFLDSCSRPLEVRNPRVHPLAPRIHEAPPLACQRDWAEPA